MTGSSRGGKPDPAATLALLQPLKALDDFVQGLDGCSDGGQQLRLLLRSLADGLKAEAVFLASVTEDETFEQVGSQRLDQQWCREFLAELLRTSAGTESPLLRSHLSGMSPVGGSTVHSAALLQISRSRGIWVVALSLDAKHVFHPVDAKLMILSRRLLGTLSQQLRAGERLKKALLGFIHCLTASIDAKDPYTCGHSERVARMAVRIGREMRLPDDALSDLYLAGLLHDIGKIGIPDGILQKAGKLTLDEEIQLRKHPVIGDRILSSVSQLAFARPGVRHHHERYDGRGYPDLLNGDKIPLVARILAVADSCDAMMSARPYRPPLQVCQIEETMACGAGSQWDPAVIQAFLACRGELYTICQRGIGDSVYAAVTHAVAAEASRDVSMAAVRFT